MTAQQERVESPRAVKTRKKLIEVALPLEKINIASAREKSIRHGHPSTLHLWWARRPLAAARAVIFSQMVDDPSEYTDELLADASTRQRAEGELGTRRALWLERTANQNEAAAAGDVERSDPGPEPTLEGTAADVERDRLFRLIEQLVEWENTTNEPLLERAHAEIRRSWRRTCADNKDHPRAAELFDPDRLPAFHDPFAGGGALPLEAQRLGLEAYASDLNPVAVLICKAMIEIPPKFAGKPPVNPNARGQTGHTGTWRGAQGLAEDVRYYGKWMRDEAEKRIGHLYPKVEITAEMARDRPDLRPYVGRSLTVIAWLWARTVKSPNPAFATVDVPLTSTFMVSAKPGSEAYVEPTVETRGYRLTVKVGRPNDPERAKNGTKLARGANFQCLMSGSPIAGDYIKAEANAGRMGARLMAIVAEGDGGRLYLPPTPEHEAAARDAKPEWKPEGAFVEDARAFTPYIYGIKEWWHLFSERQLVALTTFSEVLQETRALVERDALALGLPDDKKALVDGGKGVKAYAESLQVYLALAIDKCADYWSTICTWINTLGAMRNTFARQALPITWDYAEVCVFSRSTGNWMAMVDWTSKALATVPGRGKGIASQSDAQEQSTSSDKVVSTDPPYYDNVPFADLSDFFYVWLRRSIRTIFPDLFATLAVPKAQELAALGYRHTGKVGAETFFVEGMTQAMQRIADQVHPAFPVTIYYAFKQSESERDGGTASTGWQTFLDAVIRAGFAMSGTWPMRTEFGNRLRGFESNALASSIILVCRPRPAAAPVATRREFMTALKTELPVALTQLERGNIAPVDLAQAAIGPGMAVYTSFGKVLDAEGKPVKVREALALINQTLDEALAEQEGDFDADSRWALTWYEQHGFAEGEYGVAEQLSKSKNTSVAGMVEAGILASSRSRVRLLKPTELDPAWDPAKDRRRPAWQSVHQLIQAADRGESALAELIAKIGPEAEIARELAYRLYVLSERKKWAQEAVWYNGLVQSWPEALRLAQTVAPEAPEQQQLFEAQ